PDESQFGGLSEADWDKFKRMLSGFRAGGGAARTSSSGVRDPAQRAAFLKQLAVNPNIPSWQRQWLLQGKSPPGYHVDHIRPLSVGGLDAPSNMRLVLRADHRLWHSFYRPWEKR